MPTGGRKTLFYLNTQTGEILEAGEIKEITAETQPEDEGFMSLNNREELVIAIKETAKVRRIFQRTIYGDNNRRKAKHLPMYRKPAWGRRRKAK